MTLTCCYPSALALANCKTLGWKYLRGNLLQTARGRIREARRNSSLASPSMVGNSMAVAPWTPVVGWTYCRL